MRTNPLNPLGIESREITQQKKVKLSQSTTRSLPRGFCDARLPIEIRIVRQTSHARMMKVTLQGNGCVEKRKKNENRHCYCTRHTHAFWPEQLRLGLGLRLLVTDKLPPA